MAGSTYSNVFPVAATTQTEQELASDMLYGGFLLVQNNTAYDCNLLIFKDTAAASKPVELALRAGGSVTYGGDLGFFRIFSSAINTAATGIKPAGGGGGYTGPGAQTSSSYVGYISVQAWDQPIPLDIPQSNFAQVSAAISGPLPAGTNNIGAVTVVSTPAASGVTSQSQTASNAAATLTIPGQAGKSIYIWGLKAGFTGGTATALLAVQDGATTVENIAVVNSYSDERTQPLKITSGNSATVSLPAGGASITGAVAVRYEIR